MTRNVRKLFLIISQEIETHLLLVKLVHLKKIQYTARNSKKVDDFAKVSMIQVNHYMNFPGFPVFPLSFDFFAFTI